MEDIDEIQFYSEFVNAYMKKGESEISIIVEMTFDPSLSELYGTPKKIYQQYTFPTATATIQLDSIVYFMIYTLSIVN